MADILIVISDVANPVWQKQRETVYRELDLLGCLEKPIIEIWNKIDLLSNDTIPILKELRNKELEDISNVSDSSSSSSSSLAVATDSLKRHSLSSKSLPKLGFRGKTHENKKDYDSNIPGDYESNDVSQQALTKPILAYKDIEKMKRNETFSLPPRSAIIPFSAKTGKGIDNLVESLETIISQYHRPTTLFVPYEGDQSIITTIRQSGKIQNLEYNEKGTIITCFVPRGLHEKLKSFPQPPVE
jgi:50S ribosomal subunit-associated GTPase HflX